MAHTKPSKVSFGVAMDSDEFPENEVESGSIISVAPENIQPEEVQRCRCLYSIDSSLFIWKAMLAPRLIVGVGISAAITALIGLLDDTSEWRGYLSESKAGVATLGALLSFSLTFRTNICYSRWWEGRTLWGQLIYASVHIAQQSSKSITNDEKFDRFTNMLIVFAWACRAQLRGRELGDNQEEGHKLVERGVLTKIELREIQSQIGWQPYYCFDVCRGLLLEIFEDPQQNTLSNDHMRAAAYGVCEDTLRDLEKAMGGMIRVKATGLPLLYDEFFVFFTRIFLILATIAWAPTMSWYTVPIVMSVYFILFLLFAIGSMMEDPFGGDKLDLPMEIYSGAIELQIQAIRERRRKVKRCPDKCNYRRTNRLSTMLQMPK